MADSQTIKGIMTGETHIRREIYDADVMEKLLAHEGIGQQTKKLLQKYKKRAYDGNHLNVTYQYGKRMETAQVGRLHPEHSLGLSAFERNIRSALAQKYYWDLDMENAQPTLLFNLCKKYGWKSEQIGLFIKNRKDILAYLMENEKLTRGEAKDICIAIFFGAWRENHPSFIDLCKEINQIKENCYTKFPEMYEIAKKKTKEKEKEEWWKDPKSGCLAIVLQNEERAILLKMDSFLKTKSHPFEVLIHDGGLIRKLSGESEFPRELIKDLEEHILKDTGFTIALSVKPMEHTFHFIEQEDTLGKLIREFEQQHFYLKDNNLVCEEDENGIVHQWTPGGAEQAIGNIWRYKEKCPFINIWTKTAKRRTYERVGFFPGVMENKSVYNIYRGPNAAAAEGDEDSDAAGVAAFKELIAVLMKRDETQINFLTNWIAHMFQHPEERVHTAIIFTGDMGLGKDMLWDFIGNYLFGSKLFFNSMNPEMELFGQFNKQIEGKILIKIEEMNGALMRKIQDKVKSFITAPTLTINNKGIPTYEIDKYSRLVGTTNDAVPVVVDETDRRFNLFHCGDEKRGNMAWFKQTWDTMVTGRRGIYSWLMEIPLGDFNPSRVFKTAYHQMLAEGEKPTQETFIDVCAADPNYDKYKRTATALYQDYCAYCEENGFQKCNIVHFSRKLSSYIEKKKIVKDFKDGKNWYTIKSTATAVPAVLSGQ